MNVRSISVAVTLVLCACNTDPAPTEAGSYPVASRTLTLTDTSRGRTLPVEVWYPADESARAAANTGEPITNMIPDTTNRASYQQLLDAAPAGCPTHTVHSARNATPAKGTWPLVIVSHCDDCVRFAYASIAERLASHGIAVAAPDHVGNTLFDLLANNAAGLTQAELAVRLGDVQFVLSELLDANAADVDASIRGRFDATKLGAMGHSFGSVTTGAFAQAEPRLKVIVGLSAPMENPLFPSVTMANIPQPVLFEKAQEDNSIGEIGNGYIDTNFMEAHLPAWEFEIANAGHFSVTDIAGLKSDFMAGCGPAMRETTTPSTPFTYVDPSQAMSDTAAWVTAVFAAKLQNDAAAAAFLAKPTAIAGVSVESR